MLDVWKEKGRELWQRFKDGMAEVILSLAGSVGVVWAISLAQALDEQELTTGSVFNSYFEGGQMGLTVLAVAGAAFGTLLRLPKGDRLWSVLTVIILLAPIVVTAFIIGDNPGFSPRELSDGTLRLLWFCFALVHLMWLIFIMRKPPEIPNAQEAGEEQSMRVGGVKGRAAERA